MFLLSAPFHLFHIFYSFVSYLCSITSLTKVSKWAVNTTLTEILVLTSTSAKECYPRIHRLSLFSLSFSLFFLSRSPSTSGQSAEIVAVAEDDPRQKRKQLLKRFQTLNTRVDRRTFSSQHVALYRKNKIPILKLIFVLLIYYLK